MSGNIELAARHLGRTFGSRTVVDDVSLHVREGEIVGLLGPNGAGKTTCFYMIVGLIRADRGQVLLADRDLSRAPMHVRARAGIGYLPQEASVFRGLSVQDNVRAALECAGVRSRRARRERTDGLLAEFGLTHLREAPGRALSGGERRRVEIARALAGEPRFILLDEPFAGVDPISVGDIKSIIAALTARGIGVLITDHNVRETLDICERAVIMAEGRVLAEGEPQALLDDARVRAVYLGDAFRL